MAMLDRRLNPGECLGVRLGQAVEGLLVGGLNFRQFTKLACRLDQLQRAIDPKRLGVRLDGTIMDFFALNGPIMDFLAVAVCVLGRFG